MHFFEVAECPHRALCLCFCLCAFLCVRACCKFFVRYFAQLVAAGQGILAWSLYGTMKVSFPAAFPGQIPCPWRDANISCTCCPFDARLFVSQNTAKLWRQASARTLSRVQSKFKGSHFTGSPELKKTKSNSRLKSNPSYKQRSLQVQHSFPFSLSSVRT